MRDQFPQVYIIYYADDIPLAYRDEGILLETYGSLQQRLSHPGLVIATEKEQKHPPFQYLGRTLYPREIKPRMI